MAGFWRFVASLHRKQSRDQEVVVDPLARKRAAVVNRRRVRGRFRRRRGDRSFANDAGYKTPQAVPESLEDADDVELHHVVVHEVAEFQRLKSEYVPEQDPRLIEQFRAEARALIRRLDEVYGWEPGEPHVADRLLQMNVMSLIDDTTRRGELTYRNVVVIRAMRAVVHGPNAGTSAIAKAAAARNLIGGPTKDEAELLRDERMLRADRYAEAVGIVDALERSHERAIADHLQVTEPETHHDAMTQDGDSRMLHREI